MRHLSLFTGAGGGELAAQHLLGWTTIGYVENEPYCQEVLKARIRDGLLHAAPIFGDVRDFIKEGFAEAYQGMVDVVSAGFPCQPFSSAGKRLGADDPRNMWPATLEAIRLVRPRFVFLENVPPLLGGHGYFGIILREMAQSGYDARWLCLSAARLGAPHKRERLWIVAHAHQQHGNPRRPQSGAFRGEQSKQADLQGGQQAVANSQSHGRTIREPQDIGSADQQSDASADGSEVLADTERGGWRARSQEGSRWETGPPLDGLRAQRQGGMANATSSRQRPPWSASEEISQSSPVERSPGCRSGAAREIPNPDSRRFERNAQLDGESAPGIKGTHRGHVDRQDCSAWERTQSALGRGPDAVAEELDWSWPYEPWGLPRVVTRCEKRRPRLKAIGNGQVPAAAAFAWQILTEGLVE